MLHILKYIDDSWQQFWSSFDLWFWQSYDFSDDYRSTLI